MLNFKKLLRIVTITIIGIMVISVSFACFDCVNIDGYYGPYYIHPMPCGIRDEIHELIKTLEDKPVMLDLNSILIHSSLTRHLVVNTDSTKIDIVNPEPLPFFVEVESESSNIAIDEFLRDWFN